MSKDISLDPSREISPRGTLRIDNTEGPNDQRNMENKPLHLDELFSKLKAVEEDQLE